MLGNFIADAVKGKKYLDYPEGVKNGILLHRFIDDFTDHHPIVLETKLLFRPRYHKLSPILVDIVYDHYLAKNFHQYHQKPLRVFVDDAYATLQNRKAEMPTRLQTMMPYMLQYDWLYNYQYKEGMQRVLLGMSRRVREGAVLQYGWEDMLVHYSEIENQFTAFFDELVVGAKHKKAQLEGS